MTVTSVFNVTDYGAVGDGSTDDSTAIQNAANDAIAAGGGQVFFPWPPVAYKTTVAINTGAADNISFVGIVPGVTIAPATSTQRVFTGSGSNAVFSSLTIAGTCALGIAWGGASTKNLLIRDCEISGATGTDSTSGGWGGGIFVPAIDGLRIEDCYLHGNGSTGAPDPWFDIQVGGNGATSTNLIFTRNRCTSANVCVNLIAFDSAYVLAEGNKCENARVAGAGDHGGYGLAFYNTGTNPLSVHHVCTASNQVRATQGTGIYYQSVFDGVIDGNILDDIAQTETASSLVVGGIGVSNCNKVTVVANQITKSGHSGIVVADNDGTLGGTLVVGNSIDGTASIGIQVGGAISRLSIVGNEVMNCPAPGIGNLDNGVAMPSASHIRIIGNSVTGARVRGVGTVWAAAGAATFSVSQTGVVENGDKILVANLAYTVSAMAGSGLTCTLSGSPSFGAGGASPVPFIIPALTLPGTGTVSSSAGAATFSASQTGIIGNGDRIVVAGTYYTISAMAGSGLTCTLSGSPTFSATTFRRFTLQSRGILLLGASNCVVDGNAIDNTAQEGIRLSDGSAGGAPTQHNIVSNNVVTDTAGAIGLTGFGIFVSGANCDMTGNHSHAGVLSQAYGGVQAVGAGTVVRANNTRTVSGVDISLTSGAIDGGGNITGSNNTSADGGQFSLVQTGGAGRVGTATLVAGTVTVSSTAAVSSVRIMLGHVTPGGTMGHLSYSINPGVGFTITSSSATDTSIVSWVFIGAF